MEIRGSSGVLQFPYGVLISGIKKNYTEIKLPSTCASMVRWGGIENRPMPYVVQA